MTWRRILQHLVGLFALASCGNVPSGLPNVSDVVENLTSRSAEDVVTADDLRRTLTPDIISQIDTRLILIELPQRQSVAILSLVETNQGVETYLSADGVAISMKDGLVVATRGFGFDLMIADVSGTVAGLQGGVSETLRMHQYLDGENQIVSRGFRCNVAFSTPSTATETCMSSGVSFANSYILNESGRILESKQWISPEIGVLEVQALN